MFMIAIGWTEIDTRKENIARICDLGSLGFPRQLYHVHQHNIYGGVVELELPIGNIWLSL